MTAIGSNAAGSNAEEPGRSTRRYAAEADPHDDQAQPPDSLLQDEQRQHGRIQFIDLYFHHVCNGLDRQGKVISAVGIAGPRERVEPNIDAFAESVSAAARKLSR
jgi:hypothetical protein